MKKEDQDVDLPDLGHEGQCERDTGTHQIERHQKRAARHAVCESPCNGRDAHISNHLDGEDCAEDQRRPVARKIKGEQAECDCGESGTQKGYDLCQKQVPISAVGENIEHGQPQRYRAIARNSARSVSELSTSIQWSM